MKQKEYFGDNTINKLRNILEKEKPKKILLITGKKSFTKSGAKKKIIPYLENYKYAHFNNVPKIPLFEEVKKVTRMIVKEKCDLVIAVGGGGVIDFAKAVNILAFQKNSPSECIKNQKKITNCGKPMIAIPTTAGSGSESTHFAVIYFKNKKYSIANKFILPKYAIIEPSFTYNVPKKIIATAGIDALCQAIESYWSVNSSVKSRKYSEESIKIILKNLVKAVNTSDKKSKNKMVKASNLAGKAINITKTTGPHALSYPLTYSFGIIHGQAVSVFLGEFFIFNSELTQTTIAKSLQIKEYEMRFKKLLRILEVNNPTSAKNKILELVLKIHLKPKLSELGIQKKDLQKIVNNVNYERLTNNPKKVKLTDLKKIVLSVF